MTFPASTPSSSGERHPVRLTTFLSMYVISTAILYNDFLNLQLSSRWPLLLASFCFAPFAFRRVVNWRWNLFSFRPSLAFFIGSYFLIEVLHAAFGASEAIGIVSLASISVFLILISRFSKDQVIASLMASCVFYLLIIYPIALFHGMVGNSISDKGIFIPQYIPILSRFSLNGNFQSGRGVIGMVGGIVAIGSVIRIRNGFPNTGNLSLLAAGIFALLASDSRGPILSFCLILVALFIPISNRARIRLLFIFPTGIVLFQGLLFAYTSINTDFSYDFGILSRQDMDISDLARAAVWNEIFRMIAASPLFGIFGYGAIGSMDALQDAFGQYQHDVELLMSAHNMLLQIFLDGGVFLALMFAFYIVRIASYGLRYATYMHTQDIDAPSLLSFVLLSGITGSILSIDRVNETMFLFVLTLAAIDKQMRYAEYQFRSMLYRPVSGERMCT